MALVAPANHPTRDGRLAILDVLKQRQSATRSRGGEPEPVANARHPDRGTSCLNQIWSRQNQRARRNSLWRHSAGNIILAAGSAGTGKTTLGVEFVYRGASQFNEPGVIVLFEVAPDKLIRDAGSSGGTWRARAGRATEADLHHAAAVRAGGAASQQPAPRGGREDWRATDLRRRPRPASSEPNGGDARDAFHLLAEGLHRENLTAMLALESTFTDPAAARTPEEFVADTILRLSVEPVQRAVLRSVEVVKSRGHEYALGRHSFRIVNGQGLEVHRRVQAPRSLQREGGAAFDPTSRIRTGIPGLDELVNGGYFVASTTLVVGISGAGKSVMALQFIAEGARRGERSLMITLTSRQPRSSATPKPSGSISSLPSISGSCICGTSRHKSSSRSPFRPDRGIVEDFKPQRAVIDSLRPTGRAWAPASAVFATSSMPSSR